MIVSFTFCSDVWCLIVLVMRVFAGLCLLVLVSLFVIFVGFLLLGLVYCTNCVVFGLLVWVVGLGWCLCG